MADIYWQGGAVAVAQVATGSIDSVDGTPANNTFTVTIGNIAISAVGDTDVATTATNLRASLNASTHPYFAAITWSGSSGDITGTADTAGVPFTAALTETGAGTGAVTDFSDTTASAGPSDGSTVTNYSGGALPSASDTLILRDNAIDIAYGLTALSAVALASVMVDDSYTGAVGLPWHTFATAADGGSPDATAPEYRATQLEVKATRIELGRPTKTSATGSSSLRLYNNYNIATQCIVHSTGSPVGNSLAVHLRTNDASRVIEVRSATGGVGVGADVPGETSTNGVIRLVGAISDKTVIVGAGVALGTSECLVEGGVLWLDCTAASTPDLTMRGGTCRALGESWNFGTVTLEAGTLELVGQVDATTVTLDGGSLDVSEGGEAATVTNLNPNSGSINFAPRLTVSNWNEPTGRVTLSIA